MSQEVFDSFYQELQEAFRSGEISTHYNDSRIHNAAIMRFMLDNSNTINMYCGEMSVFRSGFYRHINEESGQGNNIQTVMAESLKKFLAKDNSECSVILENENPEVLKDTICQDEINEALKKEKLKIYYLPSDFTFKSAINHFTLCDKNLYRFEDDKTSHSAICRMFDTANNTQLKNNYNTLLTIARKM